MSDPLADMCTRIRNAAAARHETVRVPHSKVKRAVAEVLSDEGYIARLTPRRRRARGTYLTAAPELPAGPPADAGGIRRVSRPGLRVYVNNGEIPRGLWRPRRRDHEHVARRHVGAGSLAAQSRRRSALLRLVGAGRDVTRGQAADSDPRGRRGDARRAARCVVKGPKGQLEHEVHPTIARRSMTAQVVVTRPSNAPDAPRAARPDARAAREHGDGRDGRLPARPSRSRAPDTAPSCAGRTSC